MLLTIAVLFPFTLVSDFEIGGLRTTHTLGSFCSCVHSSIIVCQAQSQLWPSTWLRLVLVFLQMLIHTGNKNILPGILVEWVQG